MADTGDEKMMMVFQQKAQLFLEKDIIAYVKTKSNENYNGKIKWVGADFFIIKDCMLGDSPIFYLEIRDLRPSNRKEGEHDK